MLREDLKHLTIDYLRDKKHISVRTANCCRNARFCYLNDIFSYYSEGKSFLNIRNSGKETCKELENLCKEIESNQFYNSLTENKLFYQTSDNISIDKTLSNSLNNGHSDEFKDQITINESEGKLMLKSLSTSQRLIVKKKYSELLRKCSVRVFNSLKKISADEFIEFYLLSQEDDIKHIRNIGRNSIFEILELRKKLRIFIEEIEKEEDSYTNEVVLGAVYRYGSICDIEIISIFYENHVHLPMFWVLEQYIKNDKSREIEILIRSYNIFKSKQLFTLEELSTKHNLTRERVRQIRNNVFHKTFKITNEIIEYYNSHLAKYGKILQNKDDWSYLLNFFEKIDTVCQESFEVKNCLKEERCDFSVEFALQIIAYIYRDRYTLLGGIDVTNKSKTWNNTFLIKREYCDIFDFEKMRIEFSNILMDNETDCLLDIKDYIANSQCWIKYDYNKTDSIINIVRDFLLYEFHLYSDDIDGHIKIPANKEKKPIDVIYDILQQTGSPMHLDEIFKEFKVILPEHKYTEAAQLRPYLQKHEAISYRNRKSVYTLKEWEHIKTGTIRDAIVEFLSENDLPQTADEITEYVLQYFPETNNASVRTSMFNDTQKRFSFFNDNIFGLKDKEYPSEYELSEQQEVLRKSFEQRLLDLELFIVEEGHFPFASSEKSKEGSLGRWWYRIINNRQHINDTQQAEVNRVKIQYVEYDTDKTIYEWNLNYNKLKCFLLENRYMPAARGDEKFLYGWFRRAKEDFQNYNLTEEQRQKYIDLAKLI